jgi:hypothetical protein
MGFIHVEIRKPGILGAGPGILGAEAGILGVESEKIESSIMLQLKKT